MLQPGDQIDIWVVEKALGSGGMGSVYRCRNRAAGRILAAVKVLEAAVRQHPEAEARFVREAEILFHLDHPNIVKVRNVRTDSDPPYLEMEFVEGESLEEVLRRGQVPFDRALSILEQCACALDYLHRQSVRHRDIKPANLLLDAEGTIKLVDFGLAVEIDTTRITQQGMAFGTVSYAPPEWVAPDRLDATLWDIYALGVVFYEMLTGQLAFPVTGTGSARQQAMQVIVGKQGHPPLDPGTRYHDDLRSLIRDMTHSDASRRIAGAGEVLERARALKREIRGDTGVTLAPMLDPPVPVTLPDPVHRRRRLGLAAVAGLGVALFGIAGVAALLGVALLALWKAPPPLDVEVTVTGAGAEVPLDLRLGGAEADRVAFPTFTFAGRQRGDTEIVWATGAPDCTTRACPGDDCPVWCLSGRETVSVRGGRTAAIDLEVTAPAPRDVVLPLPDLPDEILVEATLDGAAGERAEGGVAFASVPPGPVSVSIVAGSCSEEARGCWPDGTCPAGCSSWEGVVAVPADPALGPEPVRLPPPAVEEAPAPAPVAPAPRPAPAGPRRRVTAGALATWLRANPDWLRGGTLGGTDAAYLLGWQGAEPPSGTSGAAATGVTWSAARAYCRDRGGLLGLDDPPLAWDDQPYLEWRTNPADPGRPALREGAGGTLVAGTMAAIGSTGFRCRR